MTTHYDVALLCAALYDEPGAPSVSWLYRTPTRDAPIYVGIVRIGKLLIVISRGSFTFRDWLRDLMALAYTPYNHPTWGPVHPGFDRGVEETHAIVKHVWKEGDRIVYAGHSKGAGNSQLLAARALDDGTVALMTLCWGEPMSGFAALSDYLSAIPGPSYQNGDDHEVDRVTTVPFSFPPQNYVHRCPLIHVRNPPQPKHFVALDLFAWHHFTLYAPVTPKTVIGE